MGQILQSEDRTKFKVTQGSHVILNAAIFGFSRVSIGVILAIYSGLLFHRFNLITKLLTLSHVIVVLVCCRSVFDTVLSIFVCDGNAFGDAGARLRTVLQP